MVRQTHHERLNLTALPPETALVAYFLRYNRKNRFLIKKARNLLQSGCDEAQGYLFGKPMAEMNSLRIEPDSSGWLGLKMTGQIRVDRLCAHLHQWQSPAISTTARQ